MNKILGSKIKRFRQKKDISRENLSNILGISIHTLSKYEQGQREPSIETLKKIAEALNVPVAELIGNGEIFGRRLTKLIKDRNINGDDLAKSLGISIEEILEFESGKEPDITTVNRIAMFFDVTTDYLIGKSNFENRTDENLIEFAKNRIKLGCFNTPRETDIMQKYHTEVKKIIDEHTSKLNETLTSYYQAHTKVNRDEIFGVLIDVISNLIHFTDFIVKLSKDRNFKYSVGYSLMGEDIQNGIINPDENGKELFRFFEKIDAIPHISEKISSMLRELENEYSRRLYNNASIFLTYQEYQRLHKK
ncbi:helix-turn-helix domain-containing protein [Clostridium sp. WILCCON 0269]|uniref:Helix-turn-helix domain-containing protein n=1 Tax=Candidatus Clostridium eludens TaxID=3381663 RepID=A0ABW8SR52_9CLOT